MVAVDNESVIFSTTFSNLYLYNLQERCIVTKKSINMQKSQDLGLFVGNNTKSSEITALAELKGKELLVVGCENGRIFIVHSQRL